MLGLSHPPAIELAERLVAIAPPGLTRVFYSDNGSTAAEVALKMAFQHWRHRGLNRPGFITLRNAYHGDTIGSVSVGGIDIFHASFGPLLFDTWQAEPGDAEHLAALLREHAHEVAAVIVEPLVQGAAGILTHPDGYLRAVRELCDEHDVLLICDEVATGFGRTGTMFACEQEGVSPDLMCVAKGLTGGYLPLAATLATERIYEAFLGEFADLKTFFHGHTYTGNPLACAAALATLEIFEREDTLARLQPKIARLRELLDEHVAPLASVREVRQRGFMVGIELTDFPLARRMGHQVTCAARRRGAFVRPLGDVIVLMAALSITTGELERLVTVTAGAIAEATAPVLQAGVATTGMAGTCPPS
jgi:adenosylmethionine-8-amino-7-oxononanoate aminotransferase